MKRLYVVPYSVFHGSHVNAVGATTKHIDLFHQRSGGHYIRLSGGLVLASIDFSSETTEDMWHSHPEVAPLPHPTFEGNMPLQAAVDNPTRNLSQKHLDALKSIGIEGHHSTLDVHNAARAIHPLVKIRPLV